MISAASVALLAFAPAPGEVKVNVTESSLPKQTSEVYSGVCRGVTYAARLRVGRAGYSGLIITAGGSSATVSEGPLWRALTRLSFHRARWSCTPIGALLHIVEVVSVTEKEKALQRTTAYFLARRPRPTEVFTETLPLERFDYYVGGEGR